MKDFSKMRQRITFQSESKTADGGGGYSLAWVDGSTVWAALKPITGHIGGEKQNAGQLQDVVRYRITTRYISGITPKMRILYDSRVFNIRSVINIDEKSEFLEIFAEEGVAV